MLITILFFLILRYLLNNKYIKSKTQLCILILGNIKKNAGFYNLIDPNTNMTNEIIIQSITSA